MDLGEKISERARRVEASQTTSKRRGELLQELEETLEASPTPDELAAAAVKLHAEHAEHEDAAGNHERAQARARA